MTVRALSHRAAAAVAIAWTAAATRAAPPLIVVDASDPAAVLVRTSVETILGVSWEDTSGNGIVLGGFFTGNTQQLVQVFPGGIQVADSPTGDTRTPLNQTWIAPFGGGWTLNDLGLWNGSGQVPIYINDGQRPYAGEITLDLSAQTGLPTLGASGPIYFGPPDNGKALGGWLARTIVRGDFDLDDRADGNDFLLWQRGDSVTPLAPADLTEWSDHYGATLTMVVPVPEPPAALLLLAGLLTAAGRRARVAAGRC